MSKHQQSKQSLGDSQRLVVWGERRKEPDWDAYVAALLAYALRQVEAEEASSEGAEDD